MQLHFQFFAHIQGKGKVFYLVRKWLGLITLTDETFIRGSKFGCIIIDIEYPNGHWDLGFLMPIVWKRIIRSVSGWNSLAFNITLGQGSTPFHSTGRAKELIFSTKGI